MNNNNNTWEKLLAIVDGQLTPEQYARNRVADVIGEDAPLDNNLTIMIGDVAVAIQKMVESLGPEASADISKFVECVGDAKKMLEMITDMPVERRKTIAALMVTFGYIDDNMDMVVKNTITMSLMGIDINDAKERMIELIKKDTKGGSMFL